MRSRQHSLSQNTPGVDPTRQDVERLAVPLHARVGSGVPPAIARPGARGAEPRQHLLEVALEHRVAQIRQPALRRDDLGVEGQALLPERRAQSLAIRPGEGERRPRQERLDDSSIEIGQGRSNDVEGLGSRVHGGHCGAIILR